MTFFSSRHRKVKMAVLLALMALGPVAGVATGSRLRVFLRDFDWSKPRTAVSFLDVLAVAPGVVYLSDDYEILVATGPSRVVGRPIRAGDTISGEIASDVWDPATLRGYRLVWARAHRHRVGKHLVSLLPLGIVALWMLSSLRVRDGLLEFKGEPERPARPPENGSNDHA